MRIATAGRGLEAARAALGDHGLGAARAVLAELEVDRRAVAASLAADRPRGLGALAELGARAHRRWREEVRARSARSPLARARVWIDDRIATDEVEDLDREDLPEARRRAIIEDLGRWNEVVRANERFAALLEPLVRRAAERRRGAPVRIIEIGSGHGEICFHLARWAAERGIPAEVTGSDIAQVYVDLGNRKAAERGAPVKYLRLNAFDLTLPDGAQDVVLVAQTIHHFSPAQLAMLFAEATRVGASAMFVDGWRSLATLAGVYAVFGAFYRSTLFHDGVISARKFYSDAELLLLSGLVPAAPRSRVFFAPPWQSVLEFAPA